MATTMSNSVKCFTNGFVINWKVGGYLNSTNQDGSRYSDEFELRDKPGVKWRLRLVTNFVHELDRQVLYVYLCNPEGKQNANVVRFMMGIYHEGGACSCEDKISEAFSYAEIPPGKGAGFSWFFTSGKFRQQINAGNANGFTRVGFAMEYVTSPSTGLTHRVPLCYDFDRVISNPTAKATESEGIQHTVVKGATARPGGDTQSVINLDDLLRTLNVNERFKKDEIQEELQEYLHENMNTTNMGH